MSSWTPLAIKKSTLSKLHHQNGYEFYQLFSWVGIYGIYDLSKHSNFLMIF